MDRDQTDAFASCPDFEVLSAWYDSELRDVALEAHVSRCPMCARLVASFTAIDHQCHEPVQLDPQSLTRIKVNTRRKIDAQPRWRLLITPMRVAAAAAVVGGIFAIRLYHTTTTSQTSQFVTMAEPSGLRAERLAMLPADAPSPMSNAGRTAELVSLGDAAADRAACDPVPCAKPTTPTPTTVVSLPAAPVQPPAAQTPAISRASLGRLPYSATQIMDFHRPSPFTSISALSQGPAVERAPGVEIANLVRHVWYVDDADAPMAELKALMPDLHDRLDSMLAPDGSAASLEVIIDDRNLSRLVNHFHSRGFGLVSAAAPQPGDTAGILFTGKKVRYQIEIVEK